MTIRLLVDGRHPFKKQVTEHLVAQSAGRVELALHFGDREADYHAPCLQRMEVRSGRLGHLMDRRIRTGANISLLASEAYREMVERGIDQLQRTSATYQYRAHNLRNLQDYLDYYHILADAYGQEIERTGATHALFLNMPHLAYDTVLYQVAQAMGLKTFVLCQTIFPQHYFSMRSIDDMGRFVHDGSEVAPLTIEKGTAPDLYYMEDRWQQRSPRGRLGPRAVWNLLKHLALRQPARLLDPGYIAGNLRRMSRIHGRLPDWRDPFAKFFHVNELAYFEHLAEHEDRPVDYGVPYVYAPLHNQPEMSTSALGGLFRDQLLMIEAVARVLPEGWQIYVKENPRQGAYARGPMFFHRLSRIRGVRLVPSDANTFELSARARLTATVSGTPGWESLRKGRPVLVFGNPWYKSLPGVYRYGEPMHLEQIAATTVDHAALELAYGQVMSRCHEGIVEPVYLDLVPGLDRQRNLEAVARTCLELLEGSRAATFGDLP